MTKTMQQQDHDAWELGYGRSSSVANSEHNSLELKAMYEALARREAAKESHDGDKEPTDE